MLLERQALAPDLRELEAASPALLRPQALKSLACFQQLESQAASLPPVQMVAWLRLRVTEAAATQLEAQAGAAEQCDAVLAWRHPREQTPAPLQGALALLSAAHLLVLAAQRIQVAQASRLEEEQAQASAWRQPLLPLCAVVWREAHRRAWKHATSRCAAWLRPRRNGYDRLHQRACRPY
jgi:hypothetical protein